MSTYFKQGIYTPINPKKFIGEKAIYRSSWELKFFRWADNSNNILKWGSENIIIPYTDPFDNITTRRYFVDNFIIFKDREGIERRMLIEIKPSKQVEKPTQSTRKKKSTMVYEQTTWIVNQTKWAAAKKWAEKKGMLFAILTEKELGIK